MPAATIWNAAQFDHGYSQLPDEQKRKAWNSLLPAQKKSYTEWWTFRKFAAVAPLDVDPRVIENREPPEPDVFCVMSGKGQYFELGEVTDTDLAQQAGIATKQGREVFAGKFSQREPLIKIFAQKCSKNYATNGLPLHLLLHYSVGHQVPHTVHVQADIEKWKPRIVQDLQRSPFDSVWLYDGWREVVLSHAER